MPCCSIPTRVRTLHSPFVAALVVVISVLATTEALLHFSDLATTFPTECASLKQFPAVQNIYFLFYKEFSDCRCYSVGSESSLPDQFAITKSSIQDLCLQSAFSLGLVLKAEKILCIWKGKQDQNRVYQKKKQHGGRVLGNNWGKNGKKLWAVLS